MSETMAQNAVNAAAAEAASQHFAAIRRLPRWRRWLLGRLAPPYPCVRAEIPAGRITLAQPLNVPPGVAIIGGWLDPVYPDYDPARKPA